MATNCPLEFFHKSEFAPIPLGLDSIVMGYLKSHHYIDLVDSLLPPNSNDLGLSWGEQGRSGSCASSGNRVSG